MKGLFSMIVISMIAVNCASYFGKKKSKKNTPQPTPYPTEEVECGMTGVWLDEDDPWGNGDYERVVDFKARNIDVCPDGAAPLDAWCRDTYTKIDFDDYEFDSRVVIKKCNEEGFLCHDGLGVHSCPDFEVQFCCPAQPSRPNRPKRAAAQSDDDDSKESDDSDNRR